jgi:hypothetical protein
MLDVGARATLSFNVFQLQLQGLRGTIDHIVGSLATALVGFMVF